MYRAYTGSDESMRDTDGTVNFNSVVREGEFPLLNGSSFMMRTPVLINPDLDESGFPYTDRQGGWCSEEAITYNPTTEEWYSAAPWSERYKV